MSHFSMYQDLVQLYLARMQVIFIDKRHEESDG